MAHLPNNWFTQHPVDAEHKRYLLLGFLKKLHGDFERHALYPGLGELQFHYRNLVELRAKRELLLANFPRQLQGIQAADLKLVYEQMLTDDDLFVELERIIQQSLPLMESSLRIGSAVYEELEDQIAVEPVGLHPLYQREGYFFLQLKDNSNLFIYRYNLNRIHLQQEAHLSLETRFLQQVQCSLSQTVNHWKSFLAKTNQELPNPAVYLFTAGKNIPIKSSYLPIAKRLLMKTLAA